MLRNASVALVLTLGLGSSLLGQEWARKMFETTSHDFGTVARGAKTDFRFVLKNLYLEDVHISGVRASCGCTSPRIETPWLKTYQSGAIVAKFNTGSFLGRKGATLTVTFDKPFPAQVQLHVKGYIRGDVMIEPGSVQLGAVDEGTAVERTVRVSHLGWGDWKIKEVKTANPHLSVTMQQAGSRRGRVAYELKVRLDETAPAGHFREHLMLVTSDSRSTQIPLLVEGEVQSGVMVSPSSLFMGVVEPGERVTKQVMVRGKRAFRIVSVSCDGEGFEFDIPTEDVPKPLHLIPITFVAGQTPGKVLQTIRIQTDLTSAAPELSAYAVIAPAASGF